MNIETLIIDHYDAVIALWKTDANIRLSEADSYENIEKFLKRNPGTSFIVKENDTIVGTIMCGHDGRRGYFHHLFIAGSCRRKGYGKQLLDMGIQALKKEGITKCHIFIAPDNYDGQKFWKQMGFFKREQHEFLIFSKEI